MDARDFDRLARLVGSEPSRRRVLKSLAGGALGAVAAVIGIDATGAAARCRTQGVVCSKNADCCSSTCLPKDRTGRRVCAECSTASDCPAGDQCHTATCSGGSCGFVAKANNTPCDDGDPDTCDDVCTNGTCAGTAVILSTDDHNCGVCGHVCSGAGAVCLGGSCCQLQVGPGAICSIDLPCCGETPCQGGQCCFPPGQGCSESNELCCSGVCGSDDTCCAPDDQATTCRGTCGPQTNNCGQSVDCGTCNITCPATARTIAGPPTQEVITIQDTTHGGLAQVIVVASDNADTPVPPYTVGTMDPLVVTSTKIDQSQDAQVSVNITTINGFTSSCTYVF